MEKFLRATEVIDWTHPAVGARAQELSAGARDAQEIARRCFEWVRDNIQHSSDFKRNPVTCNASDVLRERTDTATRRAICWLHRFVRMACRLDSVIRGSALMKPDRPIRSTD